MAYLKVLTLAAIAVVLTSASVLAHEVTYTGTVISAQATEEGLTVRVNVVDEKTKKVTAMAFDVDKETKILRGETQVALAQAAIVKDERISVTVDHDMDETLAMVVKLAPKG
ncbi:MAG: hypothetical protein R2752_07280 [Vicinamibacterales bacterium]